MTKLGNIQTIGIIGMGKVGNCITNFIQNKAKNDTNSIKISWICSKHFTVNSDLKIINNLLETLEIPDAIMICTSDDLIKKTADNLANIFKKNLNGKFIFHSAGAFGIELLVECKKFNAITVAAHPFQTFFFNDANCLENIAWGIECEENYRNEITNFIKKLHGKPYFLSPEILMNKAFYHIVATVASNYFAGTIYLSKLLADEIGIDKNDFLLPIINQTVANFAKTFADFNEKNNNKNADFPLTGPIIRSNFDTILKHLTVLKNYENLSNSYAYFGLGILELAEKNAMLSHKNYSRMKELFFSSFKKKKLNKDEKIDKNIENFANKINPINKIIVGLGNFGSEFSQTRHNIGYAIATALIEKYNGKIEKIPKIANYSIIEIAKQKVLIALPLTYMNKSGLAAKKLLEKFKLTSKNLLIIVDEYNFPLGKIHIKSSGSDGGHNGVFSLIEELETEEFYRLRCGIDRNFGQNELINYVLAPFSDSEIPTVSEMIQNSIKAIEFFISNDAGKSMSYVNSGKILID